MQDDILKPVFQIFYVVIPTISIVGNSLIIYVTIRSERVFCVITTPLVGIIYTVCMRSIVVIDLLIVTCYILFRCFLKRVRIGYDTMKNIHRSLIVISLTVVLGSLSTTFTGSLVEALQLNMERADADLLTGLFINSSCSINFFVFYAISKDYRQVFQKYLFCERFKSAEVSHDSDIRRDMLKPFYQVFYIFIPTISVIGNSLIIYVTIRSNILRSTCHTMIALISFCDILHSFGHYVMMISYNM
ncbi:hypothetical protein GCK32_016244 [Trichostrongylus colubriformis]|uniref:G-protein coupled receptors family 1 profile domain-containing protein n=1 Tax=Trichostrongylus colubriformis TaxID=6319 RepID=A0AAN8G0F3_TRICO